MAKLRFYQFLLAVFAVFVAAYYAAMGHLYFKGKGELNALAAEKVKHDDLERQRLDLKVHTGAAAPAPPRSPH